MGRIKSVPKRRISDADSVLNICNEAEEDPSTRPHETPRRKKKRKREEKKDFDNGLENADDKYKERREVEIQKISGQTIIRLQAKNGGNEITDDGSSVTETKEKENGPCILLQKYFTSKTDLIVTTSCIHNRGSSTKSSSTLQLVKDGSTNDSETTDLNFSSDISRKENPRNKSYDVTSKQDICLLMSFFSCSPENLSSTSNNCKQSTNEEDIMTKHDERWVCVAEGVCKGLLRCSIRAIRYDRHFECVKKKTETKCGGSAASEASDGVTLSIFLLPLAFHECSPWNIPKSPPIPAAKKQGGSYYHATLLRNALGSIFPDSLLADTSSNTSSSENILTPCLKSSVSRASEYGITPEMVYRTFDNAHALEWCSNNDGMEKIEITRGTEHRNSQIGEELEARDQKDSVMAIDGLVPKLRPYQEAAVKWMLERETGAAFNDSGGNGNNKVEGNDTCDTRRRSERAWQICWIVISVMDDYNVTLMPLYKYHKEKEYYSKQQRPRPEHKDDHICVYYCPFTGWLCHSIDDARRSMISNTKAKSFKLCGNESKYFETDQSVVYGGILAESMGLGKTVEVLACIMSNRCMDEIDYKFPLINDIHLNKKKKFLIDDDDVCFCGYAGCMKNHLLSVRCISCDRVMHGSCAGFCNENERQRETSDGYCHEDRCPSCFAAKHSNEQIPSRATLIITPRTILNQWEREFRRHISTNKEHRLKIIVYPGVRSICHGQTLSSKTTMINTDPTTTTHLLHPQILADADIVLMTFDTLTQELGHSCGSNPFVLEKTTTTHNRRELRKRKKYRVVPSPLTCIHWWRICLDEAQRVETPTAASAKMSLQLSSRHKWCVTGTPIGRGKLEDLYGLTLFLGLEPFKLRNFFRHCLNPDHRDVMERIGFMFKDILWRSTKDHDIVRNQLGIPEQEEKRTFLEFSSIERHFYNQHFEETMVVASTASREKAQKELVKKKGRIDILNANLQRLRAACCHPQVGTHGICRISSVKKNKKREFTSGILTMDQILDRLIDSARTKCEESQRIVILHNNVLACLHRLKVESKNRTDLEKIPFLESNESLLLKSKEIYIESIKLKNENSRPTRVSGEIILHGSIGFFNHGGIVNEGRTSLKWSIKESRPSEIWATIQFEGPAKCITEIKVRYLDNLPHDYECKNTPILFPKDVVLQVSSASVGGEFVDVKPFVLKQSQQDPANAWATIGGFRTNKSKIYRILIKNYHDINVTSENPILDYFVGLELELMEPEIRADDLQILHILHNALVLEKESEVGMKYNEKLENKEKDEMVLGDCGQLTSEISKLESLYMATARGLHDRSQYDLKNSMKKKIRCCSDFSNGSDLWWRDAISWCKINGSTSQRECMLNIVTRDLFELTDTNGKANQSEFIDNFPNFHDVDGLEVALKLFMERIGFDLAMLKKADCIVSVSKLSKMPSEFELLENSQCKICRKDWFQKGPKCRHCKLEDALSNYEKKMTNQTVFCALKSLFKWMKDLRTDSSNNEKTIRARYDHSKKRTDQFPASIFEKAKKYFELYSSMKKELINAKRAWRTHFDLLSDYDELHSAKKSMRLPYVNEDVYNISDHEKIRIVNTCDIAVLTFEHQSKKVMALGELRRSKQTLRFLKNQSSDGKPTESSLVPSLGTDRFIENQHMCILCQSHFQPNENTAVLSCGHFFHQSPCLERFVAKTGKKQHIRCPLRCTTLSKLDDIMVTSYLCRNTHDGRSKRIIKGSWGTKVDCIVSDVKDVIERGEKSIVFSQWDDMLTIIEQAFGTNDVAYVRGHGSRTFGKQINKFRSDDCSVLLLNVKNGAEGLTLVEATHVFMVEPLLNVGLDNQAISRVHRIGQTSKTFVHRYILKDTVEEKIDKFRKERQRNDERKFVKFNGNDEGFSQEELNEILS